MKRFSIWMAAAASTLLLGAPPASAQLLDGLLGNNGLGETVGGLAGSVLGDGQGNGLVQDVIDVVGLGAATGNGQLLDLDTTGDRQIGVGGVATIGVGGNGSVNGTVLGGGGPSLGLPLDGILGGGAGVNIRLPGGILGDGGILGGGQGPRGPGGSAGAPGAPGGSVGIGGGGRYPAIGGGGGGGAPAVLNSSRLKLLAGVLQNRFWLRFAQGNKVCLPAFGVANVANWIKPNEYGGLYQLLGAYGDDIATLQQMLKRCRNGQDRRVDIGRVIGVDFKDGQVVVMTM
jgi:hypothetical protein